MPNLLQQSGVTATVTADSSAPSSSFYRNHDDLLSNWGLKRFKYGQYPIVNINGGSGTD